MNEEIKRELAERPDEVATFELFASELQTNPDLWLNFLRQNERWIFPLARAYNHLGKPILAVVQLRKLAALRPSREVYLELAHTYVKLDKPKEALAAAQEAERL